MKRPKPRDPRPVMEETIQAVICEFLWLYAHPKLIWFSVPNGIPASAATGARFKKTGMKAGVADLVFIRPDRTAAFMEVKVPGGRQSTEQKAFQLQCEALGVPYEIVHSSFEAEAVLTRWGALRGAERARAA